MIQSNVLKKNFYNKIANKLNDTQKNAKAYWSVIKMLLNNKKIPFIPPLYSNNCFITDFKEKAKLFNLFFSKRCFLISSNSSLPNYINYTTEKRLSTVAHFQLKLLAKLFKILILIKHMVMIT